MPKTYSGPDKSSNEPQEFVDADFETDLRWAAGGRCHGDSKEVEISQKGSAKEGGPEEDRSQEGKPQEDFEEEGRPQEGAP
jgi:hypothetical protein